MIRGVEKMGISLEQYCDSVNREQYQFWVDYYTGKQLDRLSSLLESFAENRVYAMAPFIEEQGDKYFSERRLLEMLSRLNYKDYPEQLVAYYTQQVADYTHQIDSLSQILSSIDHLINNEYGRGTQGWGEYQKLNLIIFSKLESIGTQEAYFAMAPLLKITNRVKDQYPYSTSPLIEFPINLWFYNKMARLLANVPLPECIHADFFDLLTPYDRDKGCTEIEAYIPKVYQWMLDNKGKYELRNPRND
jgi:hypothetical protein